MGDMNVSCMIDGREKAAAENAEVAKVPEQTVIVPGA